MTLDEAVAIYRYLQYRTPGNISEKEQLALREAWLIIRDKAIKAIAEINNEEKLPHVSRASHSS